MNLIYCPFNDNIYIHNLIRYLHAIYLVAKRKKAEFAYAVRRHD